MPGKGTTRPRGGNGTAQPEDAGDPIAGLLDATAKAGLATTAWPPRGPGSVARSVPDGDGLRQLALLDRGEALDGEVIPPEAAPPDKRHYPSPAEMEKLFGEVNAAYAALARTTVEKAAEVGQVLIKVKERFAHGSWLDWLERHTKIKRRAAANYMLLARAKAELPARKWATVADLGVREAITELGRRQREAQQAEREEVLDGTVVGAEPMPPARRLGSPSPPSEPKPVVRDRGHEAVEQVCSLLHRLRELAEKTTPETIRAKCPDRLLHNLDLSLAPATAFLVGLLAAHEKADGEGKAP
jgi:hypothetical protein